MQPNEYVKYDALGLAELVRNKEVTPAELVEAAISRIESHNPKLNAVVRRLDDYARTASKQELGDGPFKGVPFLLKDLFSSLANVPTSFGSKFAKDFTLDRDSEIVTRFKRAGLVIVGKTNTPEYGILPVTEPELHGPTRNPWNLEHTSGGSSGGSAAAVAAGIVPAAHGGDGGGSIRIPASCCGLFGFKPTEGSSPTGPHFGRQWQGLALEHALTRTVRDSAALLDAITQRPNGQSHLSQVSKEPRKLKVALITEPFFKADLHPDCLKAVKDVAKLCEGLGHQVEEADLDINRRKLTYSFLVMIAAETAASVDYFSEKFGRKPKPNELEALTHVTRRGGNYFKAKDLAKAIQEFDAARVVMAKFYENYDIILTPTLARPPVKVGELNQRPMGERIALSLLSRFAIGPMIKVAFETMPDSAFAFTPFTPLFNITGQPAMSVPLHWNDGGLPIGVQFAAKYGEDATLFQLAGQLEQARPWREKIPPLSN